MTDTPLAALLDDLETRASLYHSSGGPHRGHYRADLTNARAAILAKFAMLEVERDFYLREAKFFSDQRDALRAALTQGREG